MTAPRMFYIDQDGTQVFVIEDERHWIVGPPDHEVVWVGEYDGVDGGFRIEDEFTLHYEGGECDQRLKSGEFE